jgi:hypothetical protein
MENKKTVGAYSYELQQKDEKINPIELQQAMHEGNESDDSYENQVGLAVKRGEELYKGNFFIVVLFKKERLMMNVVRQYFMPRKTCPRPEYDQVVYKYNREAADLSFIWVIPDKQSCESIPMDILKYPKEQKEFLHYVMDFNSGKLDKLCDEINMKEGIL